MTNFNGSDLKYDENESQQMPRSYVPTPRYRNNNQNEYTQNTNIEHNQTSESTSNTNNEHSPNNNHNLSNRMQRGI